NFTGQIPQTGWKDHWRTRVLRFNSNKLTGPIPDELPDSPKLQHLYFGSNNLSGPISTNHSKYADENEYPVFDYMGIQKNKFVQSDYQALLDVLGSDKLKVGEQNAPDNSGSQSLPDSPSLSSPKDGATNQPTTLSLDWSSSDNVDEFQVQVATVDDFSSTTVDKSNITSSIKEISGLDYSTNYYW